MRTIHWLPISSALILLLSGCANNPPTAGTNPDGTGPFDDQGNYHEEWANDPSKWNKPGKRSQATAQNDDLLPVVGKNEEPPPNANPLAPYGGSKPKSTSRNTVADVTHDTQSHTTATTTKATSKPTSRNTTSKVKSSSQVASNKPKSKTTVKTSTKSKAKSSTRHTVKAGDSLWSLARKYGTSVTAIQKANNISGTNIRDGRSLVIPKR